MFFSFERTYLFCYFTSISWFSSLFIMGVPDSCNLRRLQCMQLTGTVKCVHVFYKKIKLVTTLRGGRDVDSAKWPCRSALICELVRSPAKPIWPKDLSLLQYRYACLICPVRAWAALREFFVLFSIQLLIELA
jgi:hypothetical protein